MNDPCLACPYKLGEESKKNLCSNPDNNLCKYWLRYQGYLEGLKETVAPTGNDILDLLKKTPHGTLHCDLIRMVEQELKDNQLLEEIPSQDTRETTRLPGN